MAGMRRNDVSALRWADIDDAADDEGVPVSVRRGQDVETPSGSRRVASPARSRTLRAAASSAPEDRVVPLSPKTVRLRSQAAARAAGVEHMTAHSGGPGRAGVGADEPGRVVMLAGGGTSPDGLADRGGGLRRHFAAFSAAGVLRRRPVRRHGGRLGRSGNQSLGPEAYLFESEEDLPRAGGRLRAGPGTPAGRCSRGSTTVHVNAGRPRIIRT